MSTIRLVSLATVIALAAGQAQAGPVLTGIKGDVLVGGGQGMAPAKTGAALKAGDRVIARSGGASLRYADGCVVAVPANAMAMVTDKSPCAGGPGLVQAAQGSSAAVALPKWPAGAYVAGVGSVAIVLGLIYGLTDPTATSP